MCCLAKECVHTSGNDNGLNLTLFASGTRVHSITRAFGHRKGLAGECRLRATQKSGEAQFNINPKKSTYRGEQLQFALPDQFSVDPLQADERQPE
jgi:hypothetical protein